MSTLPHNHLLDHHPINNSPMYSKVDFTKPWLKISTNCWFDLTPAGILPWQVWTHRPRRINFSKTPNTETNIRYTILQSLDWTLSFSTDFQDFGAVADFYINPYIQETEWWNPFDLAAKINSSDKPIWHEEVMKAEITTMKKRPGEWYHQLQIWIS